MIVAIFGSPRRNGNTQILMDKFISAFEKKIDVKKYYLQDLVLNPCISCGKCEQTGICIFKDNIWNIYENIEKSKGIIMSSPIYFGSMSSQLKIFVDRAQPFWVRKYLLGQKSTKSKKGVLISVGGMNIDKHFDNLDQIAKIHMNVLDIDYTDNIFFKGIDKKGEIKNIPHALHQTYLCGKKFIELVNR